MSVKMIFDIIETNYLQLSSLLTSTFQIERREIDNDYQVGYEYLVFFSDKTALLIGRTEIIEDYANSINYHCFDYYQENEIDVSAVLKKLQILL